MSHFSGQKVTVRVTFGVTLGGTPKVTFWSLLSYFEFFGVLGVLGGTHFHKSSVSIHNVQSMVYAPLSEIPPVLLGIP